MSRFLLSVVMLATLNYATVIGAPTPQAEPKPGKAATVEKIRKVLDSVVNLEFKGEALPDVLHKLGEDHKVAFTLDTSVFQQIGIDPGA